MDKETLINIMQDCKTKLTKIWGEIFTDILIKNSIFYVYTLDSIEETKKDIFNESNEIEKLLATQLPKNTDFDGKTALKNYVDLSIKNEELKHNLVKSIESSKLSKQKIEIENELNKNYDSKTKKKLITHAYFEDFSKKYLKSQCKSAEQIDACLQTINNLNPKSYDLLVTYGYAYLNYDKLTKQNFICSTLNKNK